MNVFITGVSSGLGEGLARVALDDGHDVWGTSRRTPAALEGDRFRFAAIDFSDRAGLAAALERFLSEAPRLDVVFLNAGILGLVRDLVDTPLEDIEAVMEVNLWSNKIAMDVLAARPERPRRVVAISSGASVNGSRGWGGYALSKAALNMLVKLYAAELDDVHLISLAPGLVDTAMQDHLCDEADATRYVALQNLKAARGTDAMPQPADAARAIYGVLPRLAEMESGTFVDIRLL